MKFEVIVSLIYVLLLNFQNVHGKKASSQPAKKHPGVDDLPKLKGTTEVPNSALASKDKNVDAKVAKDGVKKSKPSVKSKPKSMFAILKDKGSYNFTKPQEQSVCEFLKFKKVNEYRRFSGDVKMNRISAAECCSMRGMRLFTIEKIDNPTFAADAKTSTGSGKWFWTSANNLASPSFVWKYGKAVGTYVEGFVKYDNTTWEAGQPSKTGHCVIAKGDGDIIMKVADCEKDMHPFMCEMEPQKAGSDVTVKEMQACIDSERQKIPGFRSHRIFKTPGRWRYANYCCQMNGWSLLDNVVAKGEKFHSALIEHEWAREALKDKSYTKPTPWTSGNDFCEFRTWAWACGELGKDLKFLAGEPNNKAMQEDCLEYRNQNGFFEANDMDCALENFVICNTKPKCTVKEQYPCGDGLRTYDVLDSISECSTSFKQIDGKDEEYKKLFHISSSPMSWTTAVSCCEKEGMELVSFIDEAKDQPEMVAVMEKMSEDGSSNAYWTMATNWLKGDPKDKSLPLQWPTGDTIAPKLTDDKYLPLHGPMYPLCGKVADVPSFGPILITADCLEKNYAVCMKHNPKADGPQVKCLTPLTREQYHLDCPDSALDISEFDKSIAPLLPKPALTEGERFKIHFQNQRMLLSLITYGIYGRRSPEHAPKLGFRLLTSVTDIYSKLCIVVQHDFIDNAVAIFQEIHYTIASHRTETLTEKDYTWILRLLNQCSENSTALDERTEMCGEEFMSVGNCTNFVCTSNPFEFKLYRTDPLIDIIWKMYEMVHSLCFTGFEESYRMYHVFAQSIMDLLANDFRLRWYNQIADDDFWQRVLGPGYKTNLINMERCNEASISSAYFHYRLDRDTIPVRTRLHGGKEFSTPSNMDIRKAG